MEESRNLQLIYQGFETAFVDRGKASNFAYKPQFISNNYKEGRKVLSSLEDELLMCEEFFISVAFITKGGVTPLLQTLKELERRNVPGRILTTDYQFFSDPEALQKLEQLSNITLKMYKTEDIKEGFHTKGYIFKSGGIYRAIVGSSNMTMAALTKNREWNTKIVSTEQGEYICELMAEFEELWTSDRALSYDVFIEKYSEKYNIIHKQRRNMRMEAAFVAEQPKLKPNSMQEGFISNLQKIREAGENKALLISATGTGKTYASAFALREGKVKKTLFLVHREQIAKQAIVSYKKVFGDTRSGKRVQELELFKRILTHEHHSVEHWKKRLKETYGRDLREQEVQNVVNVMTNEFPAGSSKNTYKECVFLEKTESDTYEISGHFSQMLANPDFVHILKELIDFGISRYQENYSDRYQDTDLVLYQKYTYEDACRLLNWEHNEVPLNIGGYKYDRKTKTFPVFINYDKAEDIQDTIRYEDHFESPSRLIAISKQSRTIDSEDVQNFLRAEERGIKVELFVRKNKDDKISKEFYYLGRMKATGEAKEFVMANTDKTAVEIVWELDTPVREDIYQYIVSC